MMGNSREQAQEIYQLYKQRGEPGIFQPQDELGPRMVGGDPATPARSELRKMCKPMGPIGLLLEAVHLQSSSVDPSWRIRQENGVNPSLQPRAKLNRLI